MSLVQPGRYCMFVCEYTEKNFPDLALSLAQNSLFQQIADTRQVLVLRSRQRPYCVECTGSHLNSEVKPRKARIVLGWVTAREVLWVPLTFLFFKLCDYPGT